MNPLKYHDIGTPKPCSNCCSLSCIPPLYRFQEALQITPKAGLPSIVISMKWLFNTKMCRRIFSGFYSCFIYRFYQIGRWWSFYHSRVFYLRLGPIDVISLRFNSAFGRYFVCDAVYSVLGWIVHSSQLMQLIV